MKISKLYGSRFNAEELKRKNELWKVLCRFFLQKYIKTDDIVVDMGAGYCEFINNIQCKVKYAVDLNEETAKFAQSDVSVFQLKGNSIDKLQDDSIDVVFMSNFLEHLKDKGEVNAVLREVHRILKKGGKVLIIQPNIKYAYREYWDFYDHHLPFSHLSLKEALLSHNFKIIKCRPKFLPFTSKGCFLRNAFLLRIFLKTPFLSKLFGRQMFLAAKKS